jgi:hypothetical protein
MNMADTMYAWSPIHYHEDDKSGLKVIKPGEQVTQEQLGVDDDAWKEMVEGGSIRPQKWPKGLDPTNPNSLSPNEHRMRQLRLEREKLELEMAGVGGSAVAEEKKEQQQQQGNGQQGNGQQNR